jgi:L,D-peptidoglycan transpeptidase YkuD (ErfK/YbiS/YcfS/YnhG family)
MSRERCSWNCKYLRLSAFFFAFLNHHSSKVDSRETEGGFLAVSHPSKPNNAYGISRSLHFRCHIFRVDCQEAWRRADNNSPTTTARQQQEWTSNIYTAVPISRIHFRAAVILFNSWVHMNTSKQQQHIKFNSCFFESRH